MKNMLMTFQANRQVTYDILQKLTNDELIIKWNRPGLDTFSKHFQEMASVTHAYIAALESGIMDFSDVPSVFEFNDIYDKEELVRMLQKNDSRLEEVINQNKYQEKVFWFDMYLPADQHFVNIISHEIFHQGMMTMQMYQAHMEMPASLTESWSLPKVE